MDGGHLDFRRLGDDVHIRASLSGADAQVDSARLTAAAAEFAGDVRSYVLSIVPALADHTSWPTWFPDRADPGIG